MNLSPNPCTGADSCYRCAFARRNPGYPDCRGNALCSPLPVPPADGPFLVDTAHGWFRWSRIDLRTLSVTWVGPDNLLHRADAWDSVDFVEMISDELDDAWRTELESSLVSDMRGPGLHKRGRREGDDLDAWISAWEIDAARGRMGRAS